MFAGKERRASAGSARDADACADAECWVYAGRFALLPLELGAGTSGESGSAIRRRFGGAGRSSGDGARARLVDGGAHASASARVADEFTVRRGAFTRVREVLASTAVAAGGGGRAEVACLREAKARDRVFGGLGCQSPGCHDEPDSDSYASSNGRRRGRSEMERFRRETEDGLKEDMEDSGEAEVSDEREQGRDVRLFDVSAGEDEAGRSEWSIF